MNTAADFAVAVCPINLKEFIRQPTVATKTASESESETFDKNSKII